MPDPTMLPSIDPATADVVGQVPVTPTDRIPLVVAAARAAQPAWAALGLAGRRAALAPLAERLVEAAPELGRLLTREMGKPLPEAEGEVRSCGAGLVDKLDQIAAALTPEVLEDEHVRSTIHHAPHGVCAAIAPWNFPLAMPHWLVVPALMAGNTVVLKPSEETPLIAQAYVELANASLPADVLQVVHGAEAQGKALVEAVGVDLIAFTGSREAGKHILAAASRDLKRVILELGGKDPLVVLDDADIEAAATFAARNSFRNAGQVCVSTERIYVARSIAPAFEAALAEKTRALTVGPGTQDGVDVGPMIHARQRDHVLAQLDAAVARGARVVVGNAGHHDNYIMPTVLADTLPSDPIVAEETFGPVVCVMAFDDDDEAVRLANASPFGLGAVVYGGDVERATTVAARLEAGMVGVNKSCGGASGTPWVGAKQSGYGYHGGPAGHRQFAVPRVVSLARG